MMAWANAGNISGEATGASSNTSIEAMRGFTTMLINPGVYLDSPVFAIDLY